MTWRPATHSEQTDRVPFDADHAPLDFVLDASDQSFVAAVRRCTRSHEPLQVVWIDPEDDEA